MAKVKRYPPTGFPERLNQAIYDRGLTKAGVAREIGVDRKSIILYTYGESTPDVTVLRRLCTVLNVSADYLIFGR